MATSKQNEKDLQEIKTIFKGLPKGVRYGIIAVPVLILFLIIYNHPDHPDHANAGPPQRNLIAERMERAKAHWPAIAVAAKQACRHPQTAEISYSDVQFTAIDSTNENVAIQGTGTAKNSFGVPDQFTYTAYYLIDLEGTDSLYYFDVK